MVATEGMPRSQTGGCAVHGAACARRASPTCFALQEQQLLRCSCLRRRVVLTEARLHQDARKESCCEFRLPQSRLPTAVYHCDRNEFLPIAVGLCASLRGVCATVLPAGAWPEGLERMCQCERTRAKMKNLSFLYTRIVALTTAACSDWPGDLACGPEKLPKGWV